MNRRDMIYDLSTIWASVKEIFPYFDRLPFDWDAQYLAYLDKLLALSADDEGGFHQLLTQFMASLNDGHTEYYPPQAYRTVKPSYPLEPPSHSWQEGVLTIKLNEFLSDHSPYVRGLLEEHPDARLVRLDIRDNRGGTTAFSARVAELFISGAFHGCQKWTQLRKANEVATASQTVLSSQESLQKYIDAGLMTEDEFEESRLILGHLKYEHYKDCYGADGHTALYQGPLDILISRRTYSAAEDFTAMFKSNRRGTIIGEPTGGSTGTPYFFKLRCGGSGRIVSVGYRLLDGTEFIGRGIQPDVFDGANT